MSSNDAQEQEVFRVATKEREESYVEEVRAAEAREESCIEELRVAHQQQEMARQAGALEA